MKQFALAMLLSVSSLLHANGEKPAGNGEIAKAKDIYKVGQSLTYEVSIPKRGLKGGPGSEFAPMILFPAVREEDFQSRYMAIRIQELRAIPGGTRVVMPIDEVAKTGEIIHKSLYFAYVDVFPQGAVAVWKDKDNGVLCSEGGYRFELPCPFLLIRPPELGFAKGVEQDGYVVNGGWGAGYAKAPAADSAQALSIQAFAFNALRAIPNPGGGDIRWCHGKELEILAQDKELLYISYRETQTWAAGDWLWTSMERRPQRRVCPHALSENRYDDRTEGRTARLKRVAIEHHERPRKAQIMKQFALAMLLSVSSLLHANGEKPAGNGEIAKATDLYKVGQSLTYEVSIPKRGLRGGPGSGISAIIEFPAVREEDFQSRYMTIRIQELRALPKGTRVVMAIDEVTKAGEIIHKSLYFAYVDVFPQGAVAVWRDKDDGTLYPEGGDRFELPCPFLLIRPPELGFAKGVEQDGYVVNGGWGAGYAKAPAADSAQALSIQAFAFKAHRTIPNPVGGDIRWCHGKELEILAQDKELLYILYRETQTWAAGDWLWTRMERRHRDGYILMRCHRIDTAHERKED